MTTPARPLTAAIALLVLGSQLGVGAVLTFTQDRPEPSSSIRSQSVPERANSSADQETAPVESEDAAIEYLVGTYGGASSDYLPLTSGQAHVPDSGELMWHGKFMNVQTRMSYSVYRDSSGHFGGRDQYISAERSALASMSPFATKAEAALQEAVTDAVPGALIPVGIWLKVDATAALDEVVQADPEVSWVGDRPLSSDATAVKKASADLYRARATIFATAESALAATLDAAGWQVGYSSTSCASCLRESRS